MVQPSVNTATIRIVEAFYESASDKGAAAQAVMSLTDYPDFLAQSGYSPQ